jgi:hypothetical protein
MSGRYVHNNGQFQQQTLGFNLDLTIQRYLHHAGKFLPYRKAVEVRSTAAWSPTSTSSPPSWPRPGSARPR